MPKEAILSLVGEKYIGDNRTQKLYLYAEPEGRVSTVPEIVSSLDSICGRCPLYWECLPARGVFNNGRTLALKANETNNELCRLPKNERGSLLIPTAPSQTIVGKSPLSRLIGN